ncbi:MAG: hypothetical protein Ct9H300mP11_20320 [Chloroflexota bacterium]|nr:MAG: hypothetical protein Ct9H300mP11_20320 [Chloroflexota bacterium]
MNTPVVSTLKAKGAFPEDNPLFVGVRGDQVNHYLEKCDLLFAVGSSLSPGRFSHGIPNALKKTIVHCTIDELHVNKVYPTAQAVIGTPNSLYRPLLQMRRAREVGLQERGG